MESLEGVHLSTAAGAVRVVISPARAALCNTLMGMLSLIINLIKVIFCLCGSRMNCGPQ